MSRVNAKFQSSDIVAHEACHRELRNYVLGAVPRAHALSALPKYEYPSNSYLSPMPKLGSPGVSASIDAFLPRLNSPTTHTGQHLSRCKIDERFHFAPLAPLAHSSKHTRTPSRTRQHTNCSPVPWIASESNDFRMQDGGGPIGSDIQSGSFDVQVSFDSSRLEERLMFLPYSSLTGTNQPFRVPSLRSLPPAVTRRLISCWRPLVATDRYPR